MMFVADEVRWAWAAVLLCAYGLLCWVVFWRFSVHEQRLLQQRRHLAEAPEGAQSVFVVYASQTGQAEGLAWRTAEMLHLAGQAVKVLPLNLLQPDVLTAESVVLFVLSTYGEGDPPDNGALFAAQIDRSAMPIPKGMRFAILALGDRQYQHFCGFGDAVDVYLRHQQAQPLFDRIDVDQMDDAPIGAWFDRVSHALGAAVSLPNWQAPAFDETGWQLVARQRLNEGSPGEAVYHLEIAPATKLSLSWAAGDLVQILPPQATHPRDYSIASIPDDGRLHLLVRMRRTETGEPGVASGWLCLTAPLGCAVSLRLRTNRGFQQGDNAHRRLILIGNGTGIAGLRAHLRERANGFESGRTQPCWLLFGERMPGVDLHYDDELCQWQRLGVLARKDAVFSRGGEDSKYVQDRLLRCRDELRTWVQEGAAIYVCGSLTGMAAGVDAALRQVLGGDVLDTLSSEGRYRRDVY